jgi:hypothetical protein
MPLYITSKIGIAGSLSMVGDNSVAWVPIILIIATILLSLRVIFPPQSWLASLDFAHNRVRFIPNCVARMIGEQAEEASISPLSTEVLICHRFVPQRVNGYRIIVRAADGAEHEIGSHSPHTQIRLSAPDVTRLAKAVFHATGLPVRVVTRRQSAVGTIEELPWNPSVAKANSFVGLAVLAACLPFVAGVTMGYLSPGATIAIGVGMVLWLGLILSLFAVSRRDPSGKKFPLLYALTTAVSFSAIYAACFVVTAYLFHPH